MKRPFLTRRDANRRLILFAIAAILTEYVLNAVSAVVEGQAMAFIWLGGGMLVGVIVVAIESLKSRRPE